MISRPKDINNQLQNGILLFLSLFPMAIIFIIDIYTSSNLAIGAMYCIVILYSWLLPGKYVSVMIALVCTILIILGFVASNDLDSEKHLEGINPMISLVVIWVCTSLVTIARRSFHGLEEVNDKLEDEVDLRTAALKKSEMRLRHMTEQIEDYVIILMDKKGNIENWNLGAEKIKGYKYHEVIGKNFRLFYTREDQISGKPERLIQKALRDGSVRDEGWRVKKDGSRFWGNITITALQNDQGEVIGLTKISRDLTERKSADDARESHNRQLNVKNKELEQFAYVASHDLQEPLRTISSFVQLLDRKYKGRLDKNADKYLQFISEAAYRMGELIKGLLDYSRLGRNYELKHVNCQHIVKAVQDDLSVMIANTNVQFEIGELPNLYAYETEFRLLLQNLISNAIKFRTEKDIPRIKISAELEEDHWKFSVKDNGIGMDKEHIDKIFVIFQRLHSRQKYAGTGIGLAHCMKIIELHGGKIWVDSKPDEGSTFHFTIPFLGDKKAIPEPV